MLSSLGAEVQGYALPPEGGNCLFNLAEVERDVRHEIGDVRNAEAVTALVVRSRPQVVFHLAAQPLVRASYLDPVTTYATNIMGTAHLLDAVRRTEDVRAVIIVTSDKCYENTGSLWGYRETDSMGGRDPYSSSKGCAELIAKAYRQSFFQQRNAARIATARSGNVIGGGDWSSDRLIPDAIRAFLAHQALKVRNPDSVRPWQHVLDPLAGYIALAERLATQGDAAEAWNFGPLPGSELSVRAIADRLVGLWGENANWQHETSDGPTEAAVLRLDCTKAFLHLGWRPQIDIDEALELTVAWYRAVAAKADMRALTLSQISTAFERAGRNSH